METENNSHSRPDIKTLYLVPHAHTDIGYSHDPLVAIELHNRFLDRAISLCEQTREAGSGESFRWTVEVFSSVLNWWEVRSSQDQERLSQCLQRGEIDIGAKYLVGTELYSPGDVAWEEKELERLVDLTGYRPTIGIQNDVNGYPMSFAKSLFHSGGKGIIMGLNTTMGHSPFPRCTAFRWQIEEGKDLIVWNGWIYNRIKSFCHLDELAAELPECWDAVMRGLPEKYPFDFAITSATMGDNVGPFESLPQQVKLFNAKGLPYRLELATAKQAMDQIFLHQDRLPVHQGFWPDFWTFGSGATPQMVSSLRRAQRRLHIVDEIRKRGWAFEKGGTLTMDRARKASAHACEHTNDSHTCGGDQWGSSDALRQRVQIGIEASTAESTSMVLLRDHLSAMAGSLPKDPVSVLIANPHPHPMQLSYLSDKKGLLNFARSRQPEHLFQFDREPTAEALIEAGTFGAKGVNIPAGEQVCIPLTALPSANGVTRESDTSVGLHTADHKASIIYDASCNGLRSWRVNDRECMDPKCDWLGLQPIIERPIGSFQIEGGGMEDMDPSDCAWNPDLTFSRNILPGGVESIREHQDKLGSQLVVQTGDSPLRSISLSLEEAAPQRLRVETKWCFDASYDVKAYYLALPVQLSGTGPCEYWVDQCGEWFRAEEDQLPGTCNSFYQSFRGVAICRGGETLYIAAADSSLFQFGGFTFGHLSDKPLQRMNPFVALWIYNNYWGTNFTAASPGLFTSRYILEVHDKSFNKETADRLSSCFDADYLSHPVA